MKLLLILAVADALVVGAAATGSPELELIDRVTQLDVAGLLLIFIVLLWRGKLHWDREYALQVEEKLYWREAALGRTSDLDRGATIAEAALAEGRRVRGRR